MCAFMSVIIDIKIAVIIVARKLVIDSLIRYLASSYVPFTLNAKCHIICRLYYEFISIYSQE